MPDGHLANNAVVLVTTGAKADLYRGAANGGAKLIHQREITPTNLDDDGPAGNRPPESSPRETDEATFSKQLSEYLYQQVHAGKIGSLVLIADPDTLGEMRPTLHQEVTDVIAREIPKTMVNATLADIESLVAEEIQND